MCGPQVYEAMARAWSRRDFLKMLGGAMAAAVLPRPQPTVWPWLAVEISGAREGDRITFTLTVRNLTEETISDLYVAGHVPRNADFVAATATPERAWFRGFEAESSDLQSAVWLAESVPPKGVLGPFRYQVAPHPAAIMVSAHGFVSWRRPIYGEAASAPAGVIVRTSAQVFRRKVDLTYVQNPNFPIWPGAPRLQIENVFNHAQHGFYANRWHIYEHHGTHMDAPVHFGKNALTIERLPAEVLVAPAAVIDIRDRARRNPDAQVTPEDIRAWERRYGRLPDGAVVFMWSGWGARVHDEAAFRNMDEKGVMHFPGFHPDTAEFLLRERSIVGIGVDTLSLDYGASTDFKTHYTILPANKWGLENVANLGRVPPAGATVFVGALRIEGASGGPVRLIAVW